MLPLIASQRKLYHEALVRLGVLSIDSHGVASNADKSSKLSCAIAKSIAMELIGEVGIQEKNVGQTLGGQFEVETMKFVRETFLSLGNLRPGKWHVERLGNRSSVKTSSFVQYQHLDYLREITSKDPLLASTLGNDYMVAPDIVIFREPESDEVINNHKLIVDDSVSHNSVIRLKDNQLPIMHASISAKWTMRSDRAQNSRTEALGLIRNRKGHLPHIAVVTAEPLPSRLASLALGTGDIDCLYHFALDELIKAVQATGAEDSIEMLKILVDGKRLKDISDLPLDLAV